MIPDKLYLHRTTGSPRLNGKFHSYKPAKIRDDDKIIEYIRKDALLEWAKEQMRLWEDRALDAIHSDTKYPIIVGTFGLKRDMFKMFIDKLNSM